MSHAQRTPSVPVSWGELLDKITILQIKLERIAGAEARRNVARELACLRAVAQRVASAAAVGPLLARLRRVNEDLWEIEDRIRACEAARDFGPAFVALARSVYKKNDRRAALKRAINDLLGSELVEEKSYASARPAPAGAAPSGPQPLAG